jgi:hypothetical protein
MWYSDVTQVRGGSALEVSFEVTMKIVSSLMYIL